MAKIPTYTISKSIKLNLPYVMSEGYYTKSYHSARSTAIAWSEATDVYQRLYKKAYWRSLKVFKAMGMK